MAKDKYSYGYSFGVTRPETVNDVDRPYCIGHTTKAYGSCVIWFSVPRGFGKEQRRRTDILIKQKNFTPYKYTEG